MAKELGGNKPVTLLITSYLSGQVKRAADKIRPALF
jgi:hypothetical protein